MTERWWAPQRGTLEPDAVVLTLLRPDDNGHTDLGTTLLAAHRAGAAACEAIAKGAVPSEAGLIQALATARTNFSEHVVESVSKSMEGTYAGLLVRDVLDDAEQGAVTLFRTAVAKGVSPPVAAQRAGAVYGVPFGSLGTYAALAVDPKTNPVALTDAADRALLAYVSKLAAEEDAGETVTFSKAPAHAHTRPVPTVSERWEEREHPRGPDGKFVNEPVGTAAPVDAALSDGPAPGTLAWVRQKLGLESNAPARVADDRAPTRSGTRTTRTGTRGARKATRTGGDTRLQPTGEVREQVKERTKERIKVSRKDRTKVLEEIDGGVLERQLTRDMKPSAMSVSMTADLLKLPRPGTDPDHYTYLNLPVSVVASGAVAEALRMRMIDQADAFGDPSTRVFRLGHLLAQSTGHMEATSQSETHAAIEEAATQAWDIAQNPPEAHMAVAEAAAPDVVTVHPDDIDASSMSDFKTFMTQQQHEMATKVLPSGRRVLDTEELAHIHILEDYRPLGAQRYDDQSRLINDTDYHLIHYKSTDPHNPHLRAKPTVDEFVILNSARGAVEGVGQNVEIDLDPNQAYQVLGKAEKFFDAENQVIVRRWHLSAVDEDELEHLLGDVDKALESAQAVVFEQLHPRDEEGRFAPAGERQTLVAPTATPTRTGTRNERATRTTRTATRTGTRAPARIPLRQAEESVRESIRERPREKTRTSTRVIELARELTRVREVSRPASAPPLPELSDARAYKVLATSDLDEALTYADGDLADLEVGGPGLTIFGTGKRILAETSDQRVDSLRQRLSLNVDEALVRQGAIATKSLGSVGINALGSTVGLAKAIDDAFDRNPDIDRIELVRHGARLHLYGNATPVAPQIIVEYDFDLDWDSPVVLEMIGEYRARDIVMSTADGRETLMDVADVLAAGGEGSIPNPQIHHFRVTSPKVKRYRAGNE